MKKIVILSAILLFLIFVTAGAVDFGGIISNETALTVDGSADFSQENTAKVWFNTGTEHPLVFYFGGSYTFNLDRPYLFDVYDLRLEGTFKRSSELPSVFGFTLGRYAFNDFTYTFMNNNVDGFKLNFTYPYAAVRIDVGFTGLQLKPVSTVLISKLDYNDQSIDAVILGSKRIVGKLETSFPNLFQRQKLSLALLFQEDLRQLFENDNTNTLSRVIPEGETQYTPERGGLVDTQYAMLGMSGPIVQALYYNVYGCLNTGRVLSYIDGAYTYTPVLAFLAGAELRYYNSAILYTRAMLQFIYTSGDADSTTFTEGNTAGKANTFIPISVIPMGLVFTPVLGNIFFPHVSYSLRPFAHAPAGIIRSIQPQLDAYVFFRSTAGAVSEGGIDPNSDSLYLGSEVDIAIRFRPFSDLGMAVSAGGFIPSGAFLTDERSFRFLVKLTANLSW